MRYFVGLIAIILVFVIGLALIFGGHKKSTKTPKPIVLTLPDYASTNAQVSFSTDGTINGDDQHREIWIIVSRDQRMVQTIQGYSGHVIDTHTQTNNQAAYSIFLKAINNAGFMNHLKGASLTADYTAICPLQNRYILTVSEGSRTISQLWTSDCGTASGNFGGNFDTIQSLFQDQITNYDDITANVELNP
jgi:hypothetical protein